MSDTLRNLASRYSFDSYPYMDNPSTQARWNQLGADMPGPPIPEPEMPVYEETPPVESQPQSPAPAATKPSWFEANKSIIAGVAAGLGLLAFLKSRH